MKNIKSLYLKNFRSFATPLEIPLDRKIITIVGPNNSGKSNLLRFLAILFNNAPHELEGSDFASPDNLVAECRMTLKLDFIREKLAYATRLMNLLSAESTTSEVDLTLLLQASGLGFQVTESLQKLVPLSYLESQSFFYDFSISSESASGNLNILMTKIGIETELTRTVHIPNIRFITSGSAPIPRFSQVKIPGQSLSFATIVNELQLIDRPPENRQSAREQKQRICDFIKFCIECSSVDLEVPFDKSTILVNIDGREHPIANLGTGIEQLLILGLGSFMFPEKLVLIDEPESHFHPRTQKRMLQYLQENSPAKFVIATHSAAVLDAVESTVIRLEATNGECKGTVVLSSAEMFNAVRDLGHTPSELVQANFAIWVEGPSDRIYINSWLRRLNRSLREGVDFTFVYYGGKVLAHHDFSGEASDLLNALSVSRQFAIVMDSDAKNLGDLINETKRRVKSQAEELNGIVWVTKGREIENYIPKSLVTATVREGINPRAGEFDKVIEDSIKINKVDYAKEVTSLDWNDEWPLDLEERVTELVAAIVHAG